MGDDGRRYAAELIGTFVLVSGGIGTAVFAGMAIGLVLTLIHLVSIPITNTSVNPARSIGPAVFVRDWALSQLWVFIVAPLVGAAIAAALFRITHEVDEDFTVAEAERALPSEQAERDR